MKIVAFAATSSTRSINKKLVTYAASLVHDASVEIIDLNDYDMPLYSETREETQGIPASAKVFMQKIDTCDTVMIAFAEHNGSYTAAYKNVFDWCSRINPKVYEGKKVLLMAASPGPGGAVSVLRTAESSMPYFNAEVIGVYSFPNFHKHFDVTNNQVIDAAKKAELDALLAPWQNR